MNIFPFHLFFLLLLRKERHLLIFFRFALQEKKEQKKKHCLISWLRSMVKRKKIPQTYPMIRISVFTGLLPFVLLLQHPMCPMSVLLLLYIPLLQCRCSTVVCYLSNAHVFCACLFKKALPKVRLGHAFARLISRSSMVLRNLVLLN